MKTIKKPIQIIIEIGKFDNSNYCLKISKDLKITYNYVHITVKTLIKKHLVKKYKIKNKALLYLTPKGWEAYYAAIKLKELRFL